MHYNNNASLVKRELLIRIIGLELEGRLEDGIDRVPYEMTCEPGYQPVRGSVYYDRSILKSRMVARLGFAVEGYVDDGTSLAPLVQAAAERRTPEGPILTVLDEACNACVKSQYLITRSEERRVGKQC